jgi:predicted AlkP superfamily pyrophosphatase or phosphodiesterase
MGTKTIPLLFVLALGCIPTAWAQTAGPHFIVIGVDGLSVDAVNTARVPRLRELMSRAAWTLEARGVMPTLSSPNWASAINGAGPEQHGITSNGYLRHKVEFQPVCQTEDGKFPTIFGLMRAEHPSSKIAVFHDWDGFSDLLEKHAPDVMQHVKGAAQTTLAAIAYWTANRPDLMFVHLDNVDHAGHAHGWFRKQYYEAVEATDGYVGQILDMIDAAQARSNTFVLVTSDHGGTNHGHGKNSLAELQIPWIFAGPGVTQGQINAPVNIFDTALTVAWIFHLDPPGCWIGRPVMAAFSPSLLAAHSNPPAAGGQLAGAVSTR